MSNLAIQQFHNNWFLRDKPKLELSSEEEDFITATIGPNSQRWEGNPNIDTMDQVLKRHPNVLDRIGSRLLSVAIAKKGCGSAVTFLLSNAVPLGIDETAYNVLHEAAWANSVDTLKSLFESGVTDATCVSVKKPHTGWPDNLSLMYWAAHSGFTEMADLLLEHGVGVHHELKIQGNGERGTTSLQEAVAPPPLNQQELRPRKLAVAKKLIDHGAHYDIYSACGLNDEQHLRAVLQDDPSSVNRPEDFGMTPLHWACRAGSMNCVNLLLERGADPDALNNGQRAPLHLAADEGQDAAIVALAEVSANLDVQDKKGRTPLHRATYLGQARAAETLLDCGANPEILNKSGKTAFEVARKDAKYFKQRV